MDVLLLPFRVIPDLPLYMAFTAALALAMYPVIIAVSRLVYGHDKTVEAGPYVRRFVLQCSILFPLVIYGMTFVFMTLLGWQS